MHIPQAHRFDFRLFEDGGDPPEMSAEALVSALLIAGDLDELADVGDVCCDNSVRALSFERRLGFRRSIILFESLDSIFVCDWRRWGPER
mgnify:CR=1 FL=1